jgi:hypothetical protein
VPARASSTLPSIILESNVSIIDPTMGAAGRVQEMTSFSLADFRHTRGVRFSRSQIRSPLHFQRLYVFLTPRFLTYFYQKCPFQTQLE